MTTRGRACAAAIAGLLSVPGFVWAQSVIPDKGVSATALPPAIPIFPLPDATLFPKISRALHIFEPRYRAMVADVLKGDRIIGMVLLRPGYEADYEGRPPVYPIGCAGVITSSEELPDGRFNIVLRGLVKFRVTGEDQSRPYRLAHVEAIPEAPTDDEQAAVRQHRSRLEVLLTPFMGGSVSTPVPPEVPDEILINALAQYLDLDPIDRQGLLERDGLLKRAQGLIELLEKIPGSSR